jgi:hypothetical protein
LQALGLLLLRLLVGLGLQQLLGLLLLLLQVPALLYECVDVWIMCLYG